MSQQTVSRNVFIPCAAHVLREHAGGAASGTAAANTDMRDQESCVVLLSPNGTDTEFNQCL